ncbi:MAG: hypothetical protein AKCLJLPJ_02476 [Fimbriimonadales bacterium]|nr:hypothetical protein [Fimbriimonadales bacterium]
MTSPSVMSSTPTMSNVRCSPSGRTFRATRLCLMLVPMPSSLTANRVRLDSEVGYPDDDFLLVPSSSSGRGVSAPSNQRPDGSVS